MQVLVLNSVPAGLRGDVTRWFMEIAPGVYVGNLSARARDALWDRILDLVGRGRALMVYPARNEQGYVIRTHQYDWETFDFDGLTLMLRPYLAEKGSERGTDPPAGRPLDDDGRAEPHVVSPSVPTDVPPRAWATAARRRSIRKRH